MCMCKYYRRHKHNVYSFFLFFFSDKYFFMYLCQPNIYICMYIYKRFKTYVKDLVYKTI